MRRLFRVLIVKAVIGSYQDYVHWEYTPNPKTEEEKRVNENLLALFGDICKMVVEQIEKEKS